ncbi:phosphatidylinositol-specific phospholipase C/glycerophosphodiester phosphodiesterase family protein [Rhodopirellula sp. P2]|uniref:phosphatidylinositol-specific phospholipase C/glycerophosphodiester phosphodiesterase family protein n=1 Tax=Rhodopirellula sp. P2 TaxID=2127060 RepID=UPI0023683036|nr:phosphatidylinositol-specific phospholipase C/glycerophosphodiester phosphodiesterase family protein [Rhodopirellula sp. P2]WDQ17555.1 phosphatidylinositol-specific phospholipase C/glycerophosphodiester phosphodiesterase family protein [Rhodopirellula sp. P2]
MNTPSPFRRRTSVSAVVPFCIAACFASLWSGAASTSSAQTPASPATVRPSHPQAHAHNDYLHERPLLDALDNGFRSIEADVFLVEGDLWVAHSVSELSADRTLKALYLDPLRQRMQSNVKAEGSSDSFQSVESDGLPVTLLIDLKSEGESTYRALNQLLSTYDDVFTHVDSKGVHRRGVTAIISGNRPIELVQSDLPRFVGVDGRLDDLEGDHSADLMPLISDHWGRHFKWRGKGELPEADRQKLSLILERAHQQNRRVRFWATPDHEAAWKVLHDAGVDLINTDDLEGLHRFLQSQSK